MSYELGIKLTTNLLQQLLFARPETMVFYDFVFNGKAFWWLPGRNSGHGGNITGLAAWDITRV